jgi:hypothetical protein
MAASLLSGCAAKKDAQEPGMANQKTSSKGLKAVIGAVFLAIGFVLLFGNLDALETPVNRILGAPASSGVECLPAVILATSHALQSYTFDHQGFLSVLRQILLSFWPLILVMTGAALLQSSSVSRRPEYPDGMAVERSRNRS